MNYKKTFLIILLISKPIFAVPFWLQTLRHPTQVGALFECSHFVGEELVRYLKIHAGPKRIIELGAGKGPITEVIAQYLTPKDQFDVVEIDPEYCVDLYKKFPKEKYPNVQIHCIDILKFQITQPYDFIICTLPLTVFEVGLLQKLQAQVKLMAKPGAYFSYVQYMFFFDMRKMLSQGISRSILQQRQDLIENFKNRYHVRTEHVLKNIPPINIFHLKL